MKTLNTILITLTPLFLVSCTSDGDRNFGQNLSNYLDTVPHERAYAVHTDINATETVKYQTDGQLTAPHMTSMMNTPVLDQGDTNAGATLSTVGALGILLESDSSHYSAVCSLNLGNYLHFNDQFKSYQPLNDVLDAHGLTHYPSGWQGTTSTIVLEQIETFGLLHDAWCGDGYFHGDGSHTNMIDPDDYKLSAVIPAFDSDLLCSNYNYDSTNCQCVDVSGCKTTGSIIDALK